MHSFVELVQAIGAIRPKPSLSTRKPINASPSPPPAIHVLEKWKGEILRRYFRGNMPVTSVTDATIFRLLFPEKDTARKFGMQETRLARYLAKILGISMEEGGRGHGLREWCAEGQEKHGCLGTEIEKVALAANAVRRLRVLSARHIELMSTLAFMHVRHRMLDDR